MLKKYWTWSKIFWILSKQFWTNRWIRHVSLKMNCTYLMQNLGSFSCHLLDWRWIDQFQKTPFETGHLRRWNKELPSGFEIGQFQQIQTILVLEIDLWHSAHWKFWLISVQLRVNSWLGVLFTKFFDILPEIVMEYQI